MLEPSEDSRSPEELAALANRPDYSAETPFNLSAEAISALKEQCKQTTREWWMSKYVKIELPVALLRGNEGNEGNDDKEERRMVVGEVVGMSENGFVLGLSGEEHQSTVIVNGFTSGENKCWLLLKEGFCNLLVC